MIKVIIADDEKRFRMYMEKILDWSALGFELCGIAANGEQVLELMEKEKPDIALLDINMPKMNGIELTERLKKVSPKTYVVFITGYSEFEYARQAVKLGVSEYLLKPFSKEELSKVVLKLKEQIIQQKCRERQRSQNRTFLIEEMLNKMMRLESDEIEELKEYKEKLEQLGINTTENYYEAIIIQPDEVQNRKILKEERNLWMFGIRNIVEELSGEKGLQGITFTNYEEQLVFIWHAQERKDIYPFIEHFCKVIGELLNLSMTIGVGSAVDRFEKIPETYRKAVISLQNQFVFGKGRIISYDEIIKRENRADFYRLDLNEKLLTALRKNDRKKIEEILMMERLEMQENQYSIDYVNAAIMGVLAVCLSYIVEMKGSIQEVLGKDFSPYQELKRIGSMEESFQWLLSVFQITTEYFKRPHSKRADQIITEVENYIEQNYSNFELTAEDISEAVFLDISYVRKIFSKYKDYTIQEYITRVRMRAAREKLESLEYSVSEVSEMCGYLDSGYFGKCFKKYYHVTPRQYVNQLQTGKAGR